MCAWLRIDVAHVHSAVGSGDDLLALLRNAGVPYCYSAHDMYLACPTVYLIDSTGRYCNATTDPPSVARVHRPFRRPLDHDIERWRARYRTFLDGRQDTGAVALGAGDAREILSGHRGDRERRTSRRRISRRGRIEAANGLALPDDDCRPSASSAPSGRRRARADWRCWPSGIRARQLPLRIVVIGYTDREKWWQLTTGSSPSTG